MRSQRASPASVMRGSASRERARFEREPDVERFAHVGERRAATLMPLFGSCTTRPSASQAAQRLAHRDAADAERVRELFLLELDAGPSEPSRMPAAQVVG